MYSFSIEDESNKIINLKTKEYFKEVLSSYYNGNYRSAVVMLSAVITIDLLYKLEELASIYNNTAIREELEILKSLSSDVNKYSEYEKKIMDVVRTKTDFFSKYDEHELENLREHRHLSAHPVINASSFELISISKETALNDIQRALRIVFNKPTLLSKDFIKIFLVEIDEIRDLFPVEKNSEFKRYIVTKYFSKCSDECLKNIFINLWKLVFSLDDEKANLNRNILRRCLAIILEDNPELIQGYFTEEQEKFSEKTKLLNHDSIEHLLDFLFDNPTFWLYLSSPIQEKLRIFVNKKTTSFGGTSFVNIEFLIRSYFITGSKDEHIKYIKDNVHSIFGKDYHHLRSLYTLLPHQEISELLIPELSYISSFAESNAYFSIIFKNINSLDSDRIIQILSFAEDNSQIRGGTRFHEGVLHLKEAAQGKIDDFDIGNYPNLMHSLSFLDSST